MQKLINWYHLDLYAEMYTPAHLERFVAQLQTMGCNGILLEIADRLHYRSLPDFAAADAFSPQALAEFCQNLRQRGFSVVPLLQHMGHLGHLLKHAPYRPMREVADNAFSLCPLHPEALPTLTKILVESLEVMRPAEFVHLGGDEAWHLGRCPKCKAFVERHSKSRLYMQHYVPLCRKVLESGLRPVLWHDMAAAHPECLEELPPETVFIDWQYARAAREQSKVMLWRHPNVSVTAAEFEKIEPREWRERYRPFLCLNDGQLNSYYSAEFLKSRGFDVIVGSACRSHGDSLFYPDNRRHFPNLVESARYARALKLAGCCLTDWSARQNSPGTRMLGICAGLGALAEGADINAAAEKFATQWCGLPAGSGATLLAVSMNLSDAAPLVVPDAGLRREDDDGWYPLDIDGQLKSLDRAEARRRIAQLRPTYSAAEATLRPLLPKAKAPGAAWLQEWALAAQSMLGWLDALEAILDSLEGKLDQKKRVAVLETLAMLENRTREVLAPIYSTHSLEQQLTVRFAGPRQFLSRP